MTAALLLLAALALVVACGVFVAAEFAFLAVDRPTQPSEQRDEAGRVERVGRSLAVRPPQPLERRLREVEAVHRHDDAVRAERLGQPRGHGGLACTRCTRDAEEPPVRGTVGRFGAVG